MKIVVLGNSGQLARSLQKTQSKNLDVTYLSHQEAPFENFEAVKMQLEKLKPTHVINTVAYTKVDLAESERDLCLLINCETPTKIAQWCKHNNAIFFHYSTDYVFNGENEVPWDEEDTPHPINVYGASKMRSEKEILAVGSSYVFRTSWIYSEFGQNFVKTMIKFFQERETLNVVFDQIGAPNYAEELAVATWTVLKKPVKLGLYHMSAPNFCSWYEFALKIKECCEKHGLKMQVKKINAVTSAEYKTIAKRPFNSRLSSEKLAREFDIHLPEWEVSLEKCVSEILKG